MTRRSLTALSMLVFLALFTAQACGPDFSPDVFVRKMQPDKPREFAAGKLGVLLPTFPRSTLTVAFRYLNGGALSPAEQRSYTLSDAGTSPEAEQQSNPESAEEKGTADPAESWAALRARFAPPAAKTGQENDHSAPGPSRWVYEGYFQNCQADAFRAAAATLHSRAITWGEKSADLADWLKAQDAVFANCQSKSPTLPPAAAAGSSALLKADRAYQVAAAEFYAAKYEDARQAFEAIGRDASSPWQGIARYLAARCLVRQAFNSKASDPGGSMATFDPGPMQQAAALLESLLREKPSGISRQAIENELDLVRLRTEPMARLHELGGALAGPRTDPGFGQHLQDLTWYLDARLDDLAVRGDFGGESQQNPPEAFSKTYLDLAPLRSSATLVDWLVTFQSPAPEAAVHAQAEWKKTGQLSWLVAAIAKASGQDGDAADLLAAAGQVKPDSPAWESLTYHRLRLLIALGRMQEARSLLDQLLPRIKAGGRDSSLNAYLGLRMTAAANLAEFLAYAPRKLVNPGSESQWALNECIGVMKNPKRQYDCARQTNPAQFSADAVGILNAQASVATLAEVASSPVLPEQLRRSVAMMGWVRSVLLKDDGAAARFFPLLPEKLQQQAGGGTGFHALLAIARNPGLRPYLDDGVQRSYSWDFVESYSDNWWCEDWGAGGFTSSKTPLRGTPVAFLPAAQQGDGERQRAELAAQGSAEVNLGGQVLAYVKAHPDDADAPESLYLVLRMIRYGCNRMEYSDPGEQKDRINRIGELRKEAARLLRQRYAASPWTKKAAPFVG